jgi:hypothetical protein
MMGHHTGAAILLQNHPGMKISPKRCLRCTPHTQINKIRVTTSNLTGTHSTMMRDSIKLTAFSSITNTFLSYTLTNSLHSHHTQNKCIHGTNILLHTIPYPSITPFLTTHTPHNTFPITLLTHHSTPLLHNNIHFPHQILHLLSTMFLLPFTITMTDKLSTRPEKCLLEDMGVLTTTLTEIKTTEVTDFMIMTEMLNSINLLPKHLRWIFLALMAQTQKNGFA